ncbi:HAD-like domain-containing protein [Desarmillaria tabescens]|uniref:HAD-like domain-containing protein n=1 Tax=Armillaria tabescens TaxID=1929756 RepID=A0AA39KHQ7_ARMTA|nr:HAD-like domain-containing protein [Desarmillaria tabescens]KAK0460196.1 HAD-like domain-containing protein [Desarmillaria tabescens]
MAMARYNAILCGLGDVLFTWSPPPNSTLPLNTLRRVLSSSTWFEYEKGRISQQACYDSLGRELSISPIYVRKAIEESCASLRCNLDLVNFLRELKDSTGETLRIFGISNISQPDYDALRSIADNMDWSIFDGIFTSFAARTRKPELKFYRYALSQANLEPSRTIFIDDKLENVLSARSQGVHGIVYREPKELKQSLLSLFGDPVQRGQNFLKENAGHFVSMCGGIAIQENFAQLLILEMTNDRSLVESDIVQKEGKWNFFRGNSQLTTDEFPCDLDTTSLGLTVVQARMKIATSIMDEMLNYVNEDGIVQTYFDHDRPRIDPVVCVNVLHLFYSYGRGSEMEQTLQWVHEVLLHRAYVEGSRYYQTAECFLFFLYRFISRCNDPVVHNRFYPLLKERILERIGAAGDGLALAMRLIVCHFTGVKNDIDLQSLRASQCEDGGWDMGLIYKYGSSGLSIGNRGLTTVMAIYAIQCSLADSSLSENE